MLFKRKANVINQPKAKVRVFGRKFPGIDRVETEFETEGGMHRSDNTPAQGVCFFVFPLDYAGLNPEFPRAHYQHLMIAHNFDWSTRRGEYIHIPYGGGIEISAC